MITGFELLPYLLALFSGQPPAGASVTRMMIAEEMVMRVPVIRPRLGWPVRWVEKKGPRCVEGSQLVAAALADEGSVDFLMRDRRRIRAKVDNACPALDFYGGFYLQSKDEKVCAGRDEIRSRMGGTCRIEKFRTMVPKPVK